MAKSAKRKTSAKRSVKKAKRAQTSKVKSKAKSKAKSIQKAKRRSAKPPEKGRFATIVGALESAIESTAHAVVGTVKEAPPLRRKLAGRRTFED
jgi:hypothetical protein